MNYQSFVNINHHEVRDVEHPALHLYKIEIDKINFLLINDQSSMNINNQVALTNENLCKTHQVYILKPFVQRLDDDWRSD